MNDAVKIKVNDREDYISMNTTNTEKPSNNTAAENKVENETNSTTNATNTENTSGT